MGYTHFFPHTQTSDKKWPNIVNDCHKLLKSLPKEIRIAGWNGYGRPEFDDEKIVFNGCIEEDNNYETFSLLKKGSRKLHFCKTQRKPYDLLVCSCLLVYKYYSPDTIELTSNGNIEDWQSSIDFVSNTLGYNVEF
jgi:hypothetical protein